MVNGKFALGVLESDDPTLCVGAISIAPYVTVLYCIHSSCLSSNLFSVSLPNREDVAALYQKGTIHTTVHLIGRVVEALEGFDASKLSQYGHLYRAFDMHTASFIKPDGLLEFDIRILVLDTNDGNP